MEWPHSWMWASTAVAFASLVVPWFVPATKRHFNLLLLVASVAIYASYEWILHSRALDGNALIRIDLFWLWPLIGAGAIVCVGAYRKRL